MVISRSLPFSDANAAASAQSLFHDAWIKQKFARGLERANDADGYGVIRGQSQTGKCPG